MHVLQAGDDIEDIVAIAAVAAMDAHAPKGQVSLKHTESSLQHIL